MKTGENIDEAIDKVFLEEYEQALIQISIAIDGTSKRKYGLKGVGARIRDFATENEVFVLNTALSGQVTFPEKGITFHDLGHFEDVVYNTIRCNLLHGDDDISEKVVYLNESRVGFNEDGKFVISPLLLWGLIFSVIGEPVNSTQVLKKNPVVQFKGIDLNLNSFWGQMDKLKSTLIDIRRNKPPTNFKGS